QISLVFTAVVTECRDKQNQVDRTFVREHPRLTFRSGSNEVCCGCESSFPTRCCLVAVVCRAKRSQQCNQLRKVSQPFSRCGDSRLRFSKQRDRNTRASGRVQRALRIASTYRVSVSTTVCTALLVPFTTLCPTFLAVTAVLFATLAAVWTGPACTLPVETATARMMEKNIFMVLKYRC